MYFALVVGRLCQSTETESATNIREGCGPLDSYLSALDSSCGNGGPGIFDWTPDEDTPDVVYYQVSRMIL